MWLHKGKKRERNRASWWLVGMQINMICAGRQAKDTPPMGKLLTYKGNTMILRVNGKGPISPISSVHHATI